MFLEFSHYDFKSKGTISAQDFAHSMAASADIKYTNKLFDRVDKLKSDMHLRDMRFTFKVSVNVIFLSKFKSECFVHLFIFV